MHTREMLSIGGIVAVGAGLYIFSSPLERLVVPVATVVYSVYVMRLEILVN